MCCKLNFFVTALQHTIHYQTVCYQDQEIGMNRIQLYSCEIELFLFFYFRGSMRPEDIGRFVFTKISWFEIREKDLERQKHAIKSCRISLYPCAHKNASISWLSNASICFNLSVIKQNLLMQSHPVALVL